MKSLLFFVLNFYTCFVFGQIFTEVSTDQYLQGVKFSAIAFADVDGDNDEDVIVTGSSQRTPSGTPTATLYLNDGTGQYLASENNVFDGVRLGDIEFSDIDNDGDPDFLISGLNDLFEPISNLYRNNGFGVFTKIEGVPFVNVYHSSISFADIDGDNDEDVLIIGEDLSATAFAELYLNDGLGNFTESTNNSFAGETKGDVEFFDVDNDGDQDFLITGTVINTNGASAKLYINDGSGNFSEASETNITSILDGDIAVADVNQDGNMDVLISGDHDGTFPGITSLYFNDGLGNFTMSTDTPFEGRKNTNLVFSDIDNDGDTDLLISGGAMYSSDITTRLYKNDGTGNFIEEIDIPFIGVRYGDAAFSDIDGDGDLDLINTGDAAFALPGYAKIYINDGTGNFSEQLTKYFKGISDSSISTADINGDGDEDVLFTGNLTYSNLSIILYENDGNANFTEELSTPFRKGTSTEFSDIDGDGDLDLFLYYFFGGSRLYINDGAGNFVEVLDTSFPPLFGGTSNFVDIDNDNDEDLFITGVDGSITPYTFLYTNDGLGNFTEVEDLPFQPVDFPAVDFSDIDLDGDLDVLILGSINSWNYSAKMYLNDGLGNFTEMPDTDFQNTFLPEMKFADIDGDGDPDLLISGRKDGFGLSTKLYINDGSGNFTETTDNPFISIHTGDVAFFDVENDGDLDLLMTGDQNTDNFINDPGTVLYLNDGLGNFSEALGEPLIDLSFSSIAVADLDGDNDLDLILSGGSESGDNVTKLYLNNTVLTFVEDNNFLDPIFSVYPNPSFGQDLTLKYHQTENVPIEITVFDIMGRPYYSKKASMSENQNQLSIDISGFSAGTYFLAITKQGETFTEKIIIQ